jgi:hypothetical protein
MEKAAATESPSPDTSRQAFSVPNFSEVGSPGIPHEWLVFGSKEAPQVLPGGESERAGLKTVRYKGIAE